MKVKTIYLAGVPASGKTTIFKRIREKLFVDAETLSFGKCKYIQAGQYYMIGVFDGSTFEGTDKLSMTAIDDCIAFILQLEQKQDRSVVFVEGDRLFNERFFLQTNARGLVIGADENVLKARHAARDNQTETFLKGRATKVARMAAKFKLTKLRNNTLYDSEIITKGLIQTAEQWIK